MRAKKKISVTVQIELLDEVECIAGTLSRSAVFEQALASWLRQQRKTKLDLEIERYYRSLTEEERSEDAAWAALGDEAIQENWGKSDA